MTETATAYETGVYWAAGMCEFEVTLEDGSVRTMAVPIGPDSKGRAIAKARAERLDALTEDSALMDSYWGWMHAFHSIPLNGCDGLGHAHDTEDFRAGFERGAADPRKSAPPAPEATTGQQS